MPESSLGVLRGDLLSGRSFGVWKVSERSSGVSEVIWCHRVVWFPRGHLVSERFLVSKRSFSYLLRCHLVHVGSFGIFEIIWCRRGYFSGILQNLAAPVTEGNMLPPFAYCMFINSWWVIWYLARSSGSPLEVSSRSRAVISELGPPQHWPLGRSALVTVCAKSPS